MTDWTVEIETGEAAASSATELERFAGALDSVRASTGAATTLAPGTGVVSATFAVEAADAVDAAARGVDAFRAALRLAGLADASPTRVSVEQVGLAEPASGLNAARNGQVA